ncbi:MAG TPA: alpha/beta fold hydrolase [Actinomycetales bacterium]|nr:alpha/beta fold hydrolase [Actinomycetales bacterium]
MTESPLVLHELTPASGDDAPLVVALHGITANGLAWRAIGEELDREVRLVAPDLRGRACSRDVGRDVGADGAAPGGEDGLAAHARDVVGVLDALGADRAVLVGHSMGAFIAALTAARYPERVSALVLVDGGIGFPAPEGVDIDEALQAVIGPAMQRLSMTFGSEQEYLDFWAAHPALGPILAGDAEGFPPGARDTLVGYLLHDLVEGEDGLLRSTCRLDAVRADGRDVLADPETLSAVRTTSVPTTFLWAVRGLLDEPQGLYDENRLAVADLPERVRVQKVDGTNHYTVIWNERGIEAVSAAILAAISTTTSP